MGSNRTQHHPATPLSVASGIALDADYVAGSSLALLGKRGAGKSYASRVLAEELVAADVHTVIIDPMGVFWGLRASADGTSDGLPIPVFGGTHGDAPLEPTAGALMADLVVDERLPMVLDLSAFGSRTQERTFVAAFLDRLYRRNRDLVHLIVDEADLFAPQRPRREDAHLLVTMENMVRRGRNKGLGITMASQRPAVLNKDVLTQVDILVALRVAAPQDRDAIRDWVRGQGDDQQWSAVAESLPGLATGEAWWWIPEQKVLQRATIRAARTYDSSPTRKRGESSHGPRAFADVDLAAISERIAATIERAKAADPRELRARIGELETQLAEAKSATESITDSPAAQLPESTVAALRTAHARIHTARENVHHQVQQVLCALRAIEECDQQVADVLAEATEAITIALDENAHTGNVVPVTGAPTADHNAAPVPPAGPPPQLVRPTAVPRAHTDSAVSPPRQRILDALADLHSLGIHHARKNQLALWTGVSTKSGGFANNLSALRTAGLIDYPSPGHIALTTAGRGLAHDVDTPPTDTELHRRIQDLVSTPRWKLLAHLIDRYPDAVTKSALAEAVGVSASSGGFANNLSALRSLGLIDYPSPGRIAATDILFLGSQPSS